MIIYCATNRLNGKKYIGQTVKTMEKRRIEHLSGARNGCPCWYFHRAINKHGAENFKWEILMYADSEKTLNDAEEIYIRVLRSQDKGIGYNIKFGGDNRRHAPETRKKISESKIGKKRNAETCMKMSKWMKGRFAGSKNPNFGKKYSAERCAEMSAARKGKKPNTQTRAKLSAARTGNKNVLFDHKVYVFMHPEHGIRSCTRSCLIREFSLDNGHVSSVISGRRTQHKGWRMAADSE